MIATQPMPANARVWIYQANRKLSFDEKAIVQQEAESFLNTWTAHNKHLLTSFEIRYDLFLVVMVDEEQANASGCSIDKLVHFIQAIEKKLSISLMNRMLFAHKNQSNVEVVSREQFEEQIKSGVIHDDTIVFNNLVQSKGELDNGWEIPLKDSWHKQIV